MSNKKWVTAIGYVFIDDEGDLHHGVAVAPGSLNMDGHEAMEKIIKEYNPWEAKYTVSEWVYLAGQSKLI